MALRLWHLPAKYIETGLHCKAIASHEDEGKTVGWDAPGIAREARSTVFILKDLVGLLDCEQFLVGQLLEFLPEMRDLVGMVPRYGAY